MINYPVKPAELYTARAANTVDAYRSDWNDFCDWCSYHQLSSFPAEPETIVNYINDLADNAKANTIARRISALTENFDAAGLKENPCRYPIVKNATGHQAHERDHPARQGADPF